ncbi:MarR family winged helix-turn-helix transcriptional regulator [Pelagibius sp. Alg239-R121]|uniref:MarR family winged helix-turn-helix transcriptional regulator n=1 Tax=Pelagibius sp. Alg239-R121 TaxID=2993448 RepID=UPI0024A6460B|nr:MarR family winged helix-turn-helix transcriptional regulator [Pelagibius sp. Alg239-R121]
MTKSAQNLDTSIHGIRLCFNQLKALGDVLHHDLGVTASMRAVMESLAETGAQTVPQIARSKEVSRQHIQIIVDDLIELGIVDLQANPQHKRSHLVVLTVQGRAIYEDMRNREKAVLKRLGSTLAPEALDALSSALAQLNERLRRELAAIRADDIK